MAKRVPEVTAPAGSELDELTLARARRGEHAAFRTLVETYHPAVHSLLWRMIACQGDAGSVDDLVQETFLRVFRHLAGFTPDGPARLSTWILTIATRIGLNHRRKMRPQPGLDVARVQGHGGPEEDARRSELTRALIAAIGELKPEHRAVVLLREYHGFDYADIAAALDLDVGTVKSRLSRARARLRDALREVDRA